METYRDPLTPRGTVSHGWAPDCLDMHTLTSRWFAVIWREESRRQTLEWYGFADSEQEAAAGVAGVAGDAQGEGWRASVDRAAVCRLYSQLRQQQEWSDWNATRKLPWLSAVRLPWRTVAPGWYALQSRSILPA